MSLESALKELKNHSSKKDLEGMKRFAISGDLGVSIYNIRKIAKTLGKNANLATKLWNTGIHEARLLACLIYPPEKLSEKKADSFAKDIDSWDLCDMACANLFDRTDFAWKKIKLWAEDNREFVRRAGFVMIASLAVHDKNAKDSDFTVYFTLIKKHSEDSRNFVRKAVNWALRQIGKRNIELNKKAIAFSEKLALSEDKNARWIAKDALRELRRFSLSKK